MIDRKKIRWAPGSIVSCNHTIDTVNSLTNDSKARRTHHIIFFWVFFFEEFRRVSLRNLLSLVNVFKWSA